LRPPRIKNPLEYGLATGLGFTWWGPGLDGRGSGGRSPQKLKQNVKLVYNF